MTNGPNGRTRATKALFTNDQVRAIRRLYEQKPKPKNLTISYIAEQLSVRRDVIKRILNYESYSDA